MGNGKNVVNVLLVDIRAWDTLGEISVLAGRRHRRRVDGVPQPPLRHRAARVGRPPDVGRIPDRDSPAVGDVTWLRGGDLHRPAAPLAGPRGRPPG